MLKSQDRLKNSDESSDSKVLLEDIKLFLLAYDGLKG